jgi:hypothetical protein
MIDTQFQWTRFHSYEIEKSGGRAWIKPIGRKRDVLEPLKLEPEKQLYLLFSELDGSEDGCLQFARRWGLLRIESPTGKEMMEDWRESIKAMQLSINLLSGNEPKRPVRDAWKVTDLDVLLVPKIPANGSSFSMVLQPRNLFEAMRLQLASGVSGGGSLRACKQCGNWFETGATQSRRSIAIFCSEKCKNRFHYLERAKR